MAPLYKAESAWVSSKYHEELMNKSSLCREANKRECSVPLPSPQAQSGRQASCSSRMGGQGQRETGRFLPGLFLGTGVEIPALLPKTWGVVMNTSPTDIIMIIIATAVRAKPSHTPCPNSHQPWEGSTNVTPTSQVRKERPCEVYWSVHIYPVNKPAFQLNLDPENISATLLRCLKMVPACKPKGLIAVRLSLKRSTFLSTVTGSKIKLSTC